MRVLPSGPLPDLVGQRLGHGLRDQRLAASRRAVQQHALGRLELVLVEQLGVQERELDRVADRLDLPLETADVLVGDVRDLLQDELLDLLLRQLLERDVGSGVEQQRVAGADRFPEQRRPERGDQLLVAPAHHDHTIVAQPVLHLHDLARSIGQQHLDDVERLVEDHLGALAQAVGFDVRRDVHAHLPSRREHVDRAVVVGGEVDAERRRRLAELLDLLAQTLDPLLLRL